MILCRVWGEGILEVYDIMGYEGTLYIPQNGDFASFCIGVSRMCC